MTYHFVVGDHAAIPLIEALSVDEGNEIVVLKDILNVGPILKEEGQTFTEMRKAFLQIIAAKENQEIALDDMERLLCIAAQMHKDENCKAWYWMAPLPADICAYYWMLPILSKIPQQFFVINIAGLPFLDDEGKLFFPKSISEINAKEIGKATKLARALSPSEIEVDTYEWKLLKEANAAIRTMGGGKKIDNQAVDFYDNILLNYCTSNFQKGNKIIGNAISKNNVPTGDLYLAWRLKELVAQNILEQKTDNSKNPKDFELRLFSENNEETTI